MKEEIVEEARKNFENANTTDDWKLIEKTWKTYETVFELWIRTLEKQR